MDVRQSYKVLGVKTGAGMDEIKAAYRRRAFELHPDLNPGDADANARFQELNEAYVLLKEALAAEPPPRGGFFGGRKKEEKPTTDKASGAESYRKQAKTEAKARPGAANGSKGPKASRPGTAFTFKKEEVLKNILSDPFARKVFEDIYSQIRREGGQATAAATGTPRPTSRRNLSLSWGDKSVNLDMSMGLMGGMRHWLRKQLDDEQTVRLAPSQLMPGNIVRLTIRRAWSGDPVTVELPIPADYVVGRPLRLRGLGRKLGPFKGDLYLRLMAG